MLQALSAGFWLGLATGPYCFMSCAPILLPCLCAEGEPALAANLKAVDRFLAGRLLAYLVFGAAAGALGAALGPTMPAWLPAAALGLTAGLMLLYAGMKNFPQLSFCLAAARWIKPGALPFWLGLMTGLNVCPPFLTGLVVVLTLGSALSGLAFFGTFFMATSLYVLPVLGVWPWLAHARVRAFGRWALFAAGAWYLYLAGVWLCGAP
ncbi:MAG: sulfite exporter TauE/SafE family protein [Elusimicrobiota bacterium]|jgi:sulfite exporter TauE/SafE